MPAVPFDVQLAFVHSAALVTRCLSIEESGQQLKSQLRVHFSGEVKASQVSVTQFKLSEMNPGDSKSWGNIVKNIPAKTRNVSLPRNAAARQKNRNAARRIGEGKP